jgi:seryl-tRNA synthetase
LSSKLAIKPFDPDRINELRIEAYNEVDRLEQVVERLRKDKINLQSMLGEVRKSRDSYKKQAAQVEPLRDEVKRLGKLLWEVRKTRDDYKERWLSCNSRLEHALRDLARRA